MREEIREVVARVWERWKRVEDGEEEEAEMDVGGMSIRLERAENGSLRYSTPVEVGFSGTTWMPSPHRPEGYPEGIPFLPDRRTSISGFEGKRHRRVAWPRSGDPDRLLAVLQEEMVALGWTRTAERRILLGLLGRELEFERGGSRGKVLVQKLPGSAAKVSLTVEGAGE